MSQLQPRLRLLVRWLRRVLLGAAALVLGALLALVSSWPWARFGRSVRSISHLDATGPIALAGATVLAMDGSPPRPATVLVEAGRIVALQADAEPVPARFRPVDAQGRWLLPGLIDAHTHVFDESDLARYLAAGVTTVRNMMGLPVHLRWRTAIETGRLAGPRLLTAGPTINGPEGYPLHRRLATPEAARAAVRRDQAAGYDLIKLYDRLSPEAFTAAADEAHRLGLPFASHVPATLPLSDLLATGPATLEHAEELFDGALARQTGEPEARALAATIAAAGVPVVPTLVVFRQIVRACTEQPPFFLGLPADSLNPVVRFLGRKPLEGWARLPPADCARMTDRAAFFSRLVGLLADAGATLLAGTDASALLTIPGPSLHRELQLLAEAGLTTDQVLAAATHDAARVLGIAAGSIVPGNDADLLLVAGDPRADLGLLAEPVGVMRAGTWLDTAALADLRTASRDQASTYTTLGRLLEGWATD